MAILAQEQDRLAARLAEIRPHLDERQWRLLLGAEARAIGRGGVKLVAKAAAASADTVSRGAGELESGIEPDGRVRRKGAGLRWRRPILGWCRHWMRWWTLSRGETRSRRCGGQPSPRRIWQVSWPRAGTR